MRSSSIRDRCPGWRVVWHLKEKMQEIDHIIDDAAKMEDKDAINYQHKMKEEVRREHARIPNTTGNLFRVRTAGEIACCCFIPHPTNFIIH